MILKSAKALVYVPLRKLFMCSVQASHAGRLRALDSHTENAKVDARQFALAAMAWACEMDTAFAARR
jgi:hypothetical protein